MIETDTIEVVNGGKRAVFTRTEAGWTPDWFYAGDVRMLRFKDHEWLAIGHVHPTTAEDAERLADGGAIFRGTARYGDTAVPWSVAVLPDRQGEGFVVECDFVPTASIELLEAYATFESPYDYTGAETVTTVIGMNPVSRWDGAERRTPPIWENPAWVYSRPQAVRITGPCSTPYLCQALTALPGVPDRYVTIIGDWNVCRVQDVYACPTRTTPIDPPGVWGNPSETKGFKYIVGALNWSSAFAKDPNVLYCGGEAYRQRVVVDFSTTVPGGTFDAMLLQAWERTALLDLPADGVVPAYDNARCIGASWGAAVGWLRDVFCSDTVTEGLYAPDGGICTYAVGSRPKAGGDYGWSWWLQWSGLLHYRAALTGDTVLADLCARNDDKYAAWADSRSLQRGIASGVTMTPSLWWAVGGGKGGVLAGAMRGLIEKTCEESAAENGGRRKMDYGAQASIAEALLLGAQAYGDPAMQAQALLLLDEMAARLDGNFWEFNMGQADSLIHGGQIRSLGHGHAVLANLLAHRLLGDAAYLERAHRFARYLLAVSYATHNGSHDPDFDWRGWCNGSNAGRDQIAEFPPWETQNGLLCLASLMAETELEGGFYDVLWYIGRTGLAQFPAARSLKRLLDESMAVHFVPRGEIASERDYYDILPYLAYENPHDQTLLASYQGSDCIVGEFVYGGGLARCDDPRVGVLVPRAAQLDLAEQHERCAHLWNPTPEVVATTLTATWPGGRTTSTSVVVPPREVVRVTV
jgi:hypothetical protein